VPFRGDERGNASRIFTLRVPSPTFYIYNYVLLKLNPQHNDSQFKNAIFKHSSIL
jgi:hypothetical protein